MWWHPDYIYRRRLLVQAPLAEDVSSWHPVTALLGWVLLDNGKVRSDFEDMEVVYVDTEGGQHLLYREVEGDEDGIHVRFQLEAHLAGNQQSVDEYFVYYGNLELNNRPDRPGFVTIDGGTPEVTGTDGDLDGGEPGSEYEDEEGVDGGTPWLEVELRDIWPVSIDHDDKLITYTRPGEHWDEGVSTHQGARATAQIYSTKFRILSEVGPDKGIMEVQLNGGDWRDVDLYWPLTDVVPVYEALDLDPHTLHEIRMRVTGRVSPQALGEEVNVKSIEYNKPVLSDDLGEQVNDLVWSSSIGGA